MNVFDSIIIGGGQAGLSVAYYFRRHKLDYLILDDQQEAGGAWLHTWDSLKLFSPVVFSSMSGWKMPQGENEYPSKDEFIDYLRAYETRYKFPIKRPVSVVDVVKQDDLFCIETDKGWFKSKTLVSATGTAQNRYIPTYPHMQTFAGQQIHSSQYKNTKPFEGQKVLIVGGGNSGAQLLAELSKVADVQWVTLKPPAFMPDHVDGRYLFQKATRTYLGESADDEPQLSLGNIVMVDTVKEARRRDVLHARRPFDSFYKDGVVWPDGEKEAFDAVIWCTGFKPNLRHLSSLNIITNDVVETEGTRAKKEPHLWLVGYGNWTGFASATIYGVGKTARATGMEVYQTVASVEP